MSRASGPAWPPQDSRAQAAAGLRTLAQRFADRTYYCAPEAHWRVGLSRLAGWRFDAQPSPDYADARVLAVVEVDSFRMTFPVARIV